MAQKGEPQQGARAKAEDLPQGDRLRGHVAVVTGSDSGIGQAIAIAFAKEGADVAVTVHEDRRGAEATARSVEGAGARAVLVDLDQREASSVEAMFRRVREVLGAPTLLVNNAGVDSTGEAVKDMPLERWHDEIRTNLHGPFYCCREFLRGLDGARDVTPVIINVTSVHQEIPRAGAAGYDCAKGALRNLTRTLALEVAEDGVRVVNIAPGMVLTPFNRSAIDDLGTRERQVQSIPMKRAASPTEIARVATFLASEEASYVHGTTVVVDGGLVLFQGQGA